MKTQFFSEPSYTNNVFVLHSHYTGDTPYRVCFDLDSSLTRWKRPFFKIPFSRNSKSSVWKPNFFPRQAKPKKFFALHFHYTGDTQFRVWFDLDNSLTRWKRFFFFKKNSKIRNSRNSQTSVWKPIFFIDKLYQQVFCSTLSLHWWYSMLRLVWFGQFLDPMKKIYF